MGGIIILASWICHFIRVGKNLEQYIHVIIYRFLYPIFHICEMPQCEWRQDGYQIRFFTFIKTLIFTGRDMTQVTNYAGTQSVLNILFHMRLKNVENFYQILIGWVKFAASKPFNQWLWFTDRIFLFIIIGDLH